MTQQSALTGCVWIVSLKVLGAEAARGSSSLHMSPPVDLALPPALGDLGLKQACLGHGSQNN